MMNEICTKPLKQLGKSLLCNPAVELQLQFAEKLRNMERKRQEVYLRMLRDRIFLLLYVFQNSYLLDL